MNEVVTYELRAYDEYDQMVHFDGISSFHSTDKHVAIAHASNIVGQIVEYDLYHPARISYTRVDKLSTFYDGTIAYENFVSEELDTVAEFHSVS